MREAPRLRFTQQQKVSVGDVRALACPVDTRASWIQVVLSLAGAVLFGSLTYGAFTASPVAYVGGTLALGGLGVAVFVLVGTLRSRIDNRPGRLRRR